jgi:RNA polymerase sigma-70 factor, ECF subfamily
MESEPFDFATVVAGLRAGDARTIEAFYRYYAPLLERLAEKHLASGMRRRVGPDDAVQSACRTFFRRAQGGQFQIEDAEGLWRLLSAITLAKVREQARFHLRKKRGLAQEEHFESWAERCGSPVEVAGAAVGPDDAVAFEEQFERLLAALDDEQRQLVDLKLQQCTNAEAAQRLGCSERTVRRLLKGIQAQLTRQLEADASEPPEAY